MDTRAATPVKRVALLGFGTFERSALASYLRLSHQRVPAYQETAALADAEFAIADADHEGTIDAVLAADRVADTVFIGSLAPDGALAWLMRPIVPLQVFRELDATVAVRATAATAPVQAPSALPAPAPAAQDTARDSSRRAGDVSAPLGALLVDDSELALRSLERQLQALGLRTDVAISSQRALELLAQRRYDLVFVDVDLGPLSDLDGLALCQQLKRQPPISAAQPLPKVLMVSAHASATDRVRGSFAGCDAYLAMPLDDEGLRRTLRQFGLRLATADAPNSRPGSLSSVSPRFDPPPAPPGVQRRS